MTNRIHDYINVIFDDVNQEEAAQRLGSHKDGATKTKFIYGILKEKNILPKSLIASKPKCNIGSLEARNEGNKFFKTKDYVSALEYYNRSICLATGGSENLAIGYANRSAVYLNSGFYTFCLDNIKLALENNYPEKLRLKLEQRRKECLKLITSREDARERCKKAPNKLSYLPDERIPIMIDGLEYAKSNQFGRYIRTKRDLYPGDVIIIEKPYSKCIVNEDWYSRCANCLKTNFLNLFPCLECTRTMFCSEDCRQESWKRFHRFECPIIDGIISCFDESPTVILAIRQTLMAFTLYDDPIALQKLLEDIDVENETLFTLDYSNLTEDHHFRAIYSHAINELGRSFIDVFRFTNTGSGIWNLLRNYTDLPMMFKTEGIEDLFLNLLFRFVQSTAFNCHTFARFGAGSFALCSLLNHSCAPNVERVVDGITNHVVVRRFIKAGDQIFDNYGPNHRETILKERQNILKAEYNFICQCEACINDYPLLEKMSAPLELYLEISEDRKLIKKYEKKFAKQKFQEYRKYLTKNYKKYPCYKMCATEGNLMECLWILMLTQPLKLHLKPVNE